MEYTCEKKYVIQFTMFVLLFYGGLGYDTDTFLSIETTIE